ncbi:MAG: c-type cytochrome [Myxococcota bacterium]
MRKRVLWLFAAGLATAGLAWASPWDIDMIDSTMFKAYEWKMRPGIPAGSVQRASPPPSAPRPGEAGAYQGDYFAKIDRFTQGDALTNPWAADPAIVEIGKARFAASCAPCHGPEGKGGGPVTHNDPEKKIARYPVPAPLLSGAGNVSAIRSDGYIYGTIRHGGAVMPAYGIALTDKERWAVVAYIRTLEGAQYTKGTP